ncbi:MAG: 50S ribosomal protein L22 [Pirellulaceae bacterium]|nr:MAG: 50S ribosomal protein L22 [Pirellulaceae bacterium]
MGFKASHRYARISARKVRPLANLVRGKFVDEALEILQFQPHRGARLLEKVLRSAIGNAQDPDQNGGRSFNPERLVVVDARVDGGPMFKRIQPRARGMAYGILRRTSHISVELESIDALDG